MRAVVLHEYGGPEKLKFEDNVPEPQISGNTVLIGAAAASVNPIDWKLRSGIRQKDSPLSFPAILGRDVSGVEKGRFSAVPKERGISKPPVSKQTAALKDQLDTELSDR